MTARAQAAPWVAAPPAIFSPRATAAYLGIGMSTLSRYRAAPDFPAAIELGPRRIGWRREDLDRWLAERPRRAS